MEAYIITNTTSGKRYVGITRKSLLNRWKQHIEDARGGRTKSAIHAAIRKCGAGNFMIEAAGIAEDWVALCALEVQLIQKHGTRCPIGYNMTRGGDGVVGLSAESRTEIGNKLRGRRHTAEARRLIGIASSGRKHSMRARLLIGAAHRGRPLLLEHRKKLAAAKLGKARPPRSIEHCAKISVGLRRAWKRRKENGF
jgi:hypothetical protein